MNTTTDTNCKNPAIVLKLALDNFISSLPDQKTTTSIFVHNTVDEVTKQVNRAILLLEKYANKFSLDTREGDAKSKDFGRLSLLIEKMIIAHNMRKWTTYYKYFDYPKERRKSLSSYAKKSEKFFPTYEFHFEILDKWLSDNAQEAEIILMLVDKEHEKRSPIFSKMNFKKTDDGWRRHYKDYDGNFFAPLY